MMAWEFALERLKRKDLDNWRQIVTTSETGGLSDVHTPVHAEPGLWMRIWFAQNPAYLEVSNTYWEERVLFYRLVYMVLPFALFLVGTLIWKGVIKPLEMLASADERWLSSAVFAFCFLSIFLALIAFVFWYAHCLGQLKFHHTQLRGRVRFNRLTRKVYVLRPEDCGGNVVLDWDRMQANFRIVNFNPITGKIKSKPRKGDAALFIYHPPDANGSREECITVGCSTKVEDESRRIWEYIREFMEDGPKDGFENGVVQPIPMWGSGWGKYSTYAGMPSKIQYSSESTIKGYEAALHMWIQSTCYWPTFPKEWQSDSGLGEPEDKPFETGAFETFISYAFQGKIDQATWEQAMDRGWIKRGAPLVRQPTGR